MHLPRGAVEQKMRSEGLDPALLDGDGVDSRGGVGGVSARSSSSGKMGNANSSARDPVLAKYHKMVSVLVCVHMICVVPRLNFILLTIAASSPCTYLVALWSTR